LLSGITALAYEIIWFRLLARIIGPSVHAFSIMLATYLLGIGFGSLAASRRVRQGGDHRRPIVALLLAIGIWPLVTLVFIDRLPIWYGRLFLIFSRDAFSLWNPLIQGAIASLLLLPATLLLGALFPFITQAYNASTHDDATLKSSVGLLYFYNTCGGVAGSLLAGFWMLPHLGVKTSLVAAGVFSILLAAVVLHLAFARSLRNTLWAAGVAGAAVVFGWVSPQLDQTVLNAGLFSEMLDKDNFQKRIDTAAPDLGQLLFFQEGVNNSVAVVANKFNDGNLTLHLSGNWVSSTEIHGRLHLKMLGHLPMLFAERGHTVGVIGYGTGITTGAALQYPGVERVNVFELEPGVVRSSRYFDPLNNRPLEDPRVQLFMVDGRSHITFGRVNYDVITADPIHPYVAGAGNLYTRDFYRIVRRHLNPGGIFCQWVPLSAISSESYSTVLNTLHEVFPHLALFAFFGESVVIASPTPLRVDWQTLTRRFQDSKVLADFQAIDFKTPFNLISFLLGAESQVDAYLAKLNRLNTDDNVWLEHRIPVDVLELTRVNLQELLSARLQASGPVPLAQIFPGIPLDVLERELAALAVDGDRHFQMAEQARKNGDLAAMERNYRITFADFNSRHYYEAGIRLAEHLLAGGRL
ncbi:MAG: hypothetical protein MUP74_03295, partial [Desulfobacterales bacterium]|nr:hypothetical protein [Desulfobacterales bacterium]